jgi:predicted PurR-regulated permease PerM
VVQTIQDVILTPKIMGKVSGLNSAIILLSLSIWGSLLGILGMIIAIPLTTLLITYYQRYVVKIPNNPTAQAGPPSYTPDREEPLDSQNLDDDDSSPMDAR